MPASFTSRICCAIWRTSRACGFSEDTSEFMNSKPPALRSMAGSGTTFTPLAPQTTVSPAMHLADRDGARPVALHDDPAVHLRVLDRHPVPAEAHDGLQVGGRVEVVGEDAVLLHLAQHRLAGVGRVHAVGLQPHDQPRQVVVAVRLHGEPCVGLVGRRLADLELVDRVVAAVLEDVVEHPGQHPGVDQVAAHLDGLAGHAGVLSGSARRRRRRPDRSRSRSWSSSGRRASRSLP